MRFSIPFGLTALAALVSAPAGLNAQNTAPVAVKLPTGAYLVLVQPEDSLPPEISGEWRIVFENGGTYRALRNGAVVVMGEYKATGDTLRLVDVSGDMACTGTAGPATYVWKAAADGSLTLVAVEDQCAGRARLTTLRALVKAKD